MTQPLRYILVGLGNMGQVWASSTLPRLAALGKAIPVAAVDTSPETFRQASAHLNLPEEHCYTDVNRACAAHSADFGIVVVPPAQHEEIVEACLAHDMHILSEKPIADTMDGSCRIYSKVIKVGKKMAVTMSHRFDQDKQTLERMLRSGVHGKLDYLVGRNTWACRQRGTWGRGGRYAIEDPLLVEGTVHQFDSMRALAGSNAATVYARTWNPEWSEFAGDSQALITIEMENGVRVFYEGAMANASGLNDFDQDYWRAECDRATLELDQRRLRIITGRRGRDATIQQAALDQQPVWMNAWLAELFVDWLNGGPAPPNTLEDNIQCAALLFAAIASTRSGQSVQVQDFLQKHLTGS